MVFRQATGYRSHALAVSAIVHGIVLGGLLLGSVRRWHVESWEAREARVLYVSAADGQAEEAAGAETVVASGASRMPDAAVQDRIEEAADQARQRSDQENLERLKRLGEGLNDVSSDASIDRMAGALHRMLGTKRRADQPAAEPVGGGFDFDTAQFHDVRREVTDEGTWRYWTTLIDARGRLFEVEMSAEEGPRVYETMQRIKQNPLLERVYRKIAMPLLDQMLINARQTARNTGSAIQ
jgi:hypothetical protein